MARVPARETVRMTMDLAKTAALLGVPTLRTSSVDVADLYAAARVYCDRIDQLLRLKRKDAQEASRLMAEARAWIKSELIPHAKVVEKRLDTMLEEL